MSNRIVVLGAAGFLGREVVRVAVARGLIVTAVVRREVSAEEVRALGASTVLGDAQEPSTWIHEARGAAALIDLVQPKLPKRLTRGALQPIAEYRAEATRRITSALLTLPADARPLYLSVSGTEDLLPDGHGIVDHTSPINPSRMGFGIIGLAVREVIRTSGVQSGSVHLGTVYGAGKAFAEQIFPGVAARKLPIIGRGDNRLPLIHIRDAARAIVHIAELPRATAVEHPWVAVAPSTTTQRALLDHVARVLDAKPPRRVPVWLASLVVGSELARSFSCDVAGDPRALLASGFSFEFPETEAGITDAIHAWKRGQRPATEPKRDQFGPSERRSSRAS